MLEVIQPGSLTTVQDLGRPGYRHLGIPLGGALDRPALSVGNYLVGNPGGAAAIEITTGTTARFIFRRDTAFVLSGAPVQGQLDSVAVTSGWRISACSGQTLTVPAPRQGMRSYLCIAGGIASPLCLGSRSTDLTSGFGGWKGRALHAGDCLPLGPQPGPGSAPAGIRLPLWETLIRALPGPEYEQFTADAKARFWSGPWRVAPQSNRVGYRLEGPALQRLHEGDLLSHAVFPGTVQVPPNGQPIVLLADAQTTGGYPRIATIIEADLWQLAQIRLAGIIQFKRCTLDEADRAHRKLAHYLTHMKAVLHAD